jgi:hypothetical protein
MPQGLPPGSTRKGNFYDSPNGGVYDLEGEYLDCTIKDPSKHARVPEGLEWNGRLGCVSKACAEARMAVLLENTSQ